MRNSNPVLRMGKCHGRQHKTPVRANDPGVLPDHYNQIAQSPASVTAGEALAGLHTTQRWQMLTRQGDQSRCLPLSRARRLAPSRWHRWGGLVRCNTGMLAPHGRAATGRQRCETPTLPHLLQLMNRHAQPLPPSPPHVTVWECSGSTAHQPTASHDHLCFPGYLPQQEW